MAEDKLYKILTNTLGAALAKPVIKDFEKNFESIASSPEARDEIADKLAPLGDKVEVMSSLRKHAQEISDRNDILPNDKLHKYLQPIIGKACTIVYVQRLEELNPELKGNDELRDKFIDLIECIPNDDKNHMVTAALKISKIKNVLAEQGDDFEFAGSYKDFENITSRLLKNFYGMAMYANSMLYDETISDEEKIASFDSPIASARTIMINDSINKDITSLEEANKEMDLIIRSSAGGKEQFPLLVQYMAEKSGLAAELVFNHKEYRKFSEWHKNKTVQDAKKQAITGKQEPDLTQIVKTGNQND